MSEENHRSKLGLVLSGGGARGAYEAGVLHYMRTMLPPEISKKRRFDVLCGSSVGAINVAHLASTAHDLTYQGKRLHELWKNVKQEDVYNRDVMSFASFMTRSFLGITRNLMSRRQDDDLPLIKKKHFAGLLNAAPLAPFLKKQVAWNQISVNIRNRLLNAVSVTATNVITGQVELFIEKHDSVPYTGTYMWHDIKLEAHHVLASAALPLIFQTIRIGRNYYMDGGVRMNTPMSPAIQLGADKILVIGLHHQTTPQEQEKIDRDLIASHEPPTMGMMLGKILSAVFLDRLDYDIEQMTRINRIIKWGEEVYGSDFVERINTHLRDNQIRGDIANRGLKKLSAMRIYPSRDVREIFAECIEGQKFFSKMLTSFERNLLKMLDVDLFTGKDFLSFIMFQPVYISRLLELGFEDARSNHDALVEFMSS